MSEIKKGLYKHFKGARITVLQTAKHTETMEDFVVYEHTDASGETAAGTMWIRPLSMFLEIVDRPEYKGPRFTYIGDLDK